MWLVIEPLLPAPKRRRRVHPGRKPLENREVLTGILFVLMSGIPWEMLPQEMGCGSGMTCWRRLRDWQRTGVWDRLHQELLNRLRGAQKIDLSRVVVDSSSVRAVHGGKKLDRTPPIAARRAANTTSVSKRRASRWRWILTAANRNDITQLLPLVEAIARIAGKPGRPVQRPGCVQGDRAYDSQPHRDTLHKRGINTQLAKRRTAHGSGLGTTRWVVERTIAWLH